MSLIGRVVEQIYWKEVPSFDRLAGLSDGTPLKVGNRGRRRGHEHATIKTQQDSMNSALHQAKKLLL